jgi:exosortase
MMMGGQSKSEDSGPMNHNSHFHPQNSHLQTQNCTVGLAAVIPIGLADFGRFPLQSRLPQALWPLGDRPILQRLITALAGQGIRQVMVCVGGDTAGIASSVVSPEGAEVVYLSQGHARGSAGCMFDAAQRTNDERLLLCQSNLLRVPNLSGLIATHEEAGADVTMAICPDGPASSEGGDFAGGGLVPFVLCNRSILQTVPSEGYCDFSEGLLPQLIRAGKVVQSYQLTEPVGSFYGWRQYLEAAGEMMASAGTLTELGFGDPVPDRPGVRAGREAKIHPTVRIIGPVMLSDRVEVAEKAILIGPCILGPGSSVGAGSVVSGSLSWDNVQIGPDCRVTNSVLTHKVTLPRGSVVESQLSMRASAMEKHPKRLVRMADTLKESLGMNGSGGGRVFGAGLSPVLMAGFLLVAASFGWAYWNPTLANLWEKLTQSDEYSSGLLVPLIALYVAWIRRDELRAVPVVPALGLGLAAFMVAQAARFAGLYLGMDSGENVSVVLTVWAILLIILGWRMIWKAKGILLFLLLTLPLPNQVQSWITLPLQRWSTSSAVFSLETLGYAVQQQGNIIDINGTQVGVAEACNGLRMVTAFFVIAGFIALIVRRSGWQKVLVFVSSVPIALVCNTIRLTVTTIAFTMIKASTWEKAFHDFGGLAMMPLALAMMVAELWVLSKLIVPETAPGPQAVVYRR